MIRNIKLILAIIVLILLVIFTSCKKRESSKREFEAGATPVRVIKAQFGEISSKLTYTGTLEAWNKIDIIPDIAGKVAKIYVEVGDYVRKGQLLAELDTRSIRLQLEQAEAALEVAKANYEDAKRNIERMRNLLEKKAISIQQYEKIKLAFEAAEAQLKQAQAAVNLAKHNLEVSIMRAPFSGIITSKNAEVGDVINPMMGGFSPTKGILTLMDFSKIKVNLHVPQTGIRRIRRGQKAILKVDAYPDKIFRGYVHVVNLAADPISKTFLVQTVFDNPDLLLKPGIFGEISIILETRSNTIIIPEKAVIDGNYVFVVKNGKAMKREVETGLREEDRVEIIRGIEEGEYVIIEGNYGLENGAKVRIEGEV
ncbi:efflux RND transporter periplasmic adaptor subunit [Candidatus Aminicenantes bacterium AC-335-K20]|nr:efflux RND transporter periplasmic adaptor subunit [SCandidatus Aminicenantes bacterium Aminicenantia_JdfR_composite]MCP2619162.1 efflux RND transporter periplasmic adaptor subunit [Candidatus Aminicenantes bacterium AC-335-K20]